jgi:hypothetical protein
MDFADLINYHRSRDADITIATTPADEDHALHLGILGVSHAAVAGLRAPAGPHAPAITRRSARGSQSHSIDPLPSLQASKLNKPGSPFAAWPLPSPAF